MRNCFFIILLSVSFHALSQCQPVANFPFDGNANDVSGNGNNGILGGSSVPVLTFDRFGNPNSAYQFGGFYNQNWIQIPNSPTLIFNSTCSVSLWFKQCSFGGMDGYGNYSPNGHFILVSKAGDGISANPGIWCFTYPDANNILDIAFNNKNGYSTNTINFIEDTTFDCYDTCEWLHCVFVIDDTTWKLYVNGQIRKQVEIPPADFSVANTQDFFIGRMYGGGIVWYPFNGVIDDVNIYNCALSQAEVAALYGNYIDPLSHNNCITIDSVEISNSCSNQSGASIITFVNSNNAPYQFSINGGPFQVSNIFDSLSQGTYIITVKSNCTSKDTTITIGNPVIFTSVSDSICQGETYTLPDGNIVNSDGVYSTVLTTVNGCDSTIVTSLFFLPQLVDSFKTQNVSCYDMKDGAIQLFALGGKPPYNFQVGILSNSSGSFSNLGAGSYDFVITDGNGCSIIGNCLIDQPSPIDITVHPADTLVESNSVIQLIASCGYSIASYSWFPTTFLSCDTCQNPTSQPTMDVTYYLAVSISKGDLTCTADTSLKIRIMPSFIIPNAFTPNGDGLNDFFQIVGNNFQNFDSFHMQLFNKWGQKIAEYDNPYFKWDGSFENKEEQIGVYTFLMVYQIEGNKTIRQGNFTLLR